MRNEGWDEQLLDGVAEALRQGGYEFMIYRLGDEHTIFGLEVNPRC